MCLCMLTVCTLLCHVDESCHCCTVVSSWASIPVISGVCWFAADIWSATWQSGLYHQPAGVSVAAAAWCWIFVRWRHWQTTGLCCSWCVLSWQELTAHVIIADMLYLVISDDNICYVLYFWYYWKCSCLCGLSGLSFEDCLNSRVSAFDDNYVHQRFKWSLSDCDSTVAMLMNWFCCVMAT